MPRSATSSAVFPPLFAAIHDPRTPGKIVYPLECLLFTAVLMFLFRLGARRQIGWVLRKPGAAAKLGTLFGVTSAPHGDTIEDLVYRLAVAEVQECVCRMIARLIRMKVLYPYRLLAKWYVIAIDGTGTLTFTERHCPHCLTRTSKTTGKTIYFHNVLEAKLVTPNGFAFSIMTEFIENPHEKPTKQDCELKALYRLAERLNAQFPRTPFMLSLDGLYACGPVFDLCRKYGWHFMAVLKDRNIPSVTEEFESLAPLDPGNRLSRRPSNDLSKEQKFRWINDISYVDDARREHVVSVVECVETTTSRKKVPVGSQAAGADAAQSEHEPVRSSWRRRRHRRGARQEKELVTVVTCKTHRWVTDIMVSVKTVAELVDDGGRLRWKVENEGFNVQKNGGFGLEHAYSNDPNSARVYYLLLQMAHILARLMDKGSLLRRTFQEGFGSEKNLSRDILEAWRIAAVTIPTELPASRFQIRFDAS